MVGVRGEYEAAVLGRALEYTPERLRPVARRYARELAVQLQAPDAAPAGTAGGTEAGAGTAGAGTSTGAGVPGDADTSTGTESSTVASVGCERRVWVWDREDGMSDLVARMPAIEAHAIKDRLTRLAKSAERTTTPARPGTPDTPSTTDAPDTSGAPDAPGLLAARSSRSRRRSRDQARVDVLRDLLLSGDPFALRAGSPAEAVSARIQLIVTAPPHTPDTSPGTPGPGSDQAGTVPALGVAELVGSGPMTTHAIRPYLAHTDTWEHVTVSTGGEVLSVGRYRPSAAMRRFLGARDLHCRFPGCRVPLAHCDIDHTVAAADGGATSTTNLAHLCRGHHTLKHHTDWDLTQDPRGVMRWRSPTGRTHTDTPPSRVRFHRPTPDTPDASDAPDAADAAKPAGTSGDPNTMPF
ncbi:HNH endonuclease signature motif containing protein [Leucobacter chromiireducens]|uniref:HNH endonuclease signature motif containing protein n=1 Tax=Leucobacter chromiireducens TaxID=283877 RepID=UPI000F63708C